MRKSIRYRLEPELKAYILRNEDKRKLYRIIQDSYKFCVIMKLKTLHDSCFESKYSKQRYLDYAYKRGIKASLLEMNKQGIIDLDSEIDIKCYVDEHSRATNGRYSLQQTLFNEFKYGVYTQGYDFKPIARNLCEVTVTYCNSENVPLVRASDIFSNRVYFYAINGKSKEINVDNTTIVTLP